MSPDDPTERTCSATGLRLLSATPGRGFRVSRDKYGGLSAQPRHVHPGAVATANRFDTVGTTLYFADSKRWPDDAHLVSSENVGIAELFDVASRLGIPVLPGRRRI